MGPPLLIYLVSALVTPQPVSKGRCSPQGQPAASPVLLCWGREPPGHSRGRAQGPAPWRVLGGVQQAALPPAGQPGHQRPDFSAWCLVPGGAMSPLGLLGLLLLGGVLPPSGPDGTCQPTPSLALGRRQSVWSLGCVPSSSCVRRPMPHSRPQRKSNWGVSVWAALGPPHPGEGPPGSGSGVPGALSFARVAASVEVPEPAGWAPGGVRSSRASGLASPQAAGHVVRSWAWRPCPGVRSALPRRSRPGVRKEV